MEIYPRIPAPPPIKALSYINLGTHKLGSCRTIRNPFKVLILDLHVGHVGGEVQKNILSVLLWAPANVGEKHCLVCPERLVASQE